MTTADTGKVITDAPVLRDYHANGGYHWMDLIAEHGWTVIPSWGSRGLGAFTGIPGYPFEAGKCSKSSFSTVSFAPGCCEGLLVGFVEDYPMAKSNSKVQHPPPTLTTAKELYGAAVCCGFPGCHEPPYRFVNGAPALNSQIAHIHARSEGGPRWLATMSPKENQSKENLIILCRFHHGVVDDPSNEHQYPADVLRQWKAAQIELATASPAYARPMAISHAQAAEVLRASELRDFALIDRTLPLVKAVTRLLATIEQSRQGPRDVAAQW